MRGPRRSPRPFNEAVYHRPPRGPSFVTIGVLTAIAVLIGGYFAFLGALPVSTGYEVTATFENATTLRTGSPVRVAGVTVGEVRSIGLRGGLAEVRFTVGDAARPLRADAEITIRPRLFLEGNFFLDLRPGSPGAAELPDGGAIPHTQTATAVQIDEILTALQRDDRENLRALLEGYGSALADRPGPGEDAGHDPDVRGESAAEALNDAFVHGGRAGRATAQVSEALRGAEPGDLGRLIEATGRTFERLASRELEVRELISGLATTAGALAGESASLGEAVGELAPTLERAEPALAELDRSLPPLRGFARALTPSIAELPATIEAGFPWLRQVRPLLGRAELGGIARELRAATPDLARATRGLRGLLPELGDLGRCASRVLVPTANARIEDEFATGSSVLHDFLYGVGSQAGLGADFDGNGPYLRLQPITGSHRVLARNRGGALFNTELYGNAIRPPSGSRPVKPASGPPVRYDVACHRNQPPELNGPAAAVGPPSPEVAP